MLTYVFCNLVHIEATPWELVKAADLKQYFMLTFTPLHGLF